MPPTVYPKFSPSEPNAAAGTLLERAFLFKFVQARLVRHGAAEVVERLPDRAKVARREIGDPSKPQSFLIRKRSSPAASWIAPSTPPPPSITGFAAYTMASTASVVISPCMILTIIAPFYRSANGADTVLREVSFDLASFTFITFGIECSFLEPVVTHTHLEISISGTLETKGHTVL